MERSNFKRFQETLFFLSHSCNLKINNIIYDILWLMIYDEFLYYLLPTIRKIVFLKTILRKWIIFRKIKNCFEKQEEILKIYFFSSRRRIILFFTIFFLHLPLKINFRAIKLFRQNRKGYENILKIISRKIKIP